MPIDASTGCVLRINEIEDDEVRSLYEGHGLSLIVVDSDQAIPGSHWGECEAGLIKHSLYYRADTPVHSILHEAGHWLLMDEGRRNALHTDAKGSQAEENAVCYLQVLMAELVPGMGRARMLADMDCWGYNFMIGSARQWFYEDADDAKATLLQHLAGQPKLAQQLGFAGLINMAQ